MDMRDFCEIVRNSVSTIEVGKALGLNVDMHNRCSCPFHNGRDRNMRLYDGNRGFYCFVCHKSGDCISLVKGVTECSYADAARWISETFRLGLEDELEQRRQKPSIWQRSGRARIRKAVDGRRRHEAEHHEQAAEGDRQSADG